MNSKAVNKPYFVLYALVLLVVAVLTLYFHSVPRHEAKDMLHEDGLVEQLSAVGYFLCVLVMLVMGKTAFLRQHFPLILLPAIFSLRELDFDKRFTDTGLLQSRIFTSPDVALLERVAGVVVMASLVALILYTLRRYFMPFFRGLFALDAVATGVGLAMAFMVVSKSIDGLGRKLEPLGIFVSEQITFEATVLEEVFELGIPVVLTIAAIAYFRRLKSAASTPCLAD